MRKNEFNTLDDFTSQYTGEWNPSESHWFGLDFSYHGKEYRFHTGAMHQEFDTILSDGRVALFGLYSKNLETNDYDLLEEFATMDDVLKSTVIDNTPFHDVVIDAETELLGQD